MMFYCRYFYRLYEFLQFCDALKYAKVNRLKPGLIWSKPLKILQYYNYYD